MTKLIEELRATMGASIPCLAISSPETLSIIRQICKYAATKGSDRDGTPKRVFIWRESIGYEEWAMFYENSETGEEEELTSPLHSVNYTSIEAKPIYITGTTGKQIKSFKPEEDFPGASVPFAIEYANNYDVDNEGRGAIFVLRDWHRYIEANADHVDRQLALFEIILEGTTDDGRTKTMIMLSPSKWDSDAIPIELSSYIRRTKYPLPDKETRIQQINNIKALYVSDPRFRASLAETTDDDMEIVADACAGLSRQQIDDVLCISMAVKNHFDIAFILDEKRKAVEQEGFTLLRPDKGFEVIGGLTPLKSWIILISKRFTQAAREYGFIRNIRGLLMAGVPGCGKTAVAKAMAKEMNMNLLMVEAQNLKGSLVGESEGKVYRLLQVAKAAAPLIVFVDEAEKLLGKSEGLHDGGAHDAVLGQFLTFMQEDDSGVLFVFTANDMRKFSPELVDRFEGRFFIDLPDPVERKEIIKIHLNMRNQDIDTLDLDELVKITADFSGRNIEDGIEEAMTVSFSEDRALAMKDLKSVFSTLVPTSRTKKDEIALMRKYVEDGSMRKANNTRQSKSSGGSTRSRIRTFD